MRRFFIALFTCQLSLCLSNNNILFSGKASNAGLQRFINNSVNLAGACNQQFGKQGSITLTGIPSNGGSYFVSGATIGGGNYDQISALVVDGDNKIVVAGFTTNAAGHYRFALARFLPNGTLDATFGQTVAGSTTSTIPGTVYITDSIAGNSNGNDFLNDNSLAIDTDGNIVVGGTTNVVYEDAAPPSYFALARFTTDGILDTTFAQLAGGNTRSLIPGTVYINNSISGLGNSDTANAVAIDNSGNIILAGSTSANDITGATSGSVFAVARFIGGSGGDQGMLDTSFGHTVVGVTVSLISGTVYINGSISDTTIDPTNPITDSINTVVVIPGISGHDDFFAGGFSGNDSGTYFAVARFVGTGGDQGILDTSFTGDGVHSQFYFPGAVYITPHISGEHMNVYDQIQAMALDHSGYLIAAGFSYPYMALACFVPTNGALLSTFTGGNGATQAVFGPGAVYLNYTIATGVSEAVSNDKAYAVRIDLAGNIIIGGYTNPQTGPVAPGVYYAVARFLGNETDIAGALDTSFGTGATGDATSATAGTMYINTFIAGGASNWLFGLGLSNEGSIVCGGLAYNTDYTKSYFSLAKILADVEPGGLDTSFGNTGPGIVSRFGGSEYVSGEFVSASQSGGRAVSVQPDGKVVVAASVVNGETTVFAVARYLSNGQPDTTFGALAGGSSLLNNSIPGLVYLTHSIAGGTADTVTSLVVAQDGTILVGGSSLDADGHSHYACMRLLPSGLLDSFFGVNTTTVTSSLPGTEYITGFIGGGTSDSLTSLALQSDGTFFAAGSTVTGGVFTRCAVASFMSNGALKADFGSTTATTTSLIQGTTYITDGIAGGVVDTVTALAITSDGSLVTGGTATDAGAVNHFFLAHFSSTGELVTSFGIPSTYTTVSIPGTVYLTQTITGGNDDEIAAMVLQSNGSILVGGWSGVLNTSSSCAFARFTAQGALDSSFGSTAGGMTSPFPGTTYVSNPLAGGAINRIRAVALEATGNILAVGSTADTNNDFHALVLSLLSGGTLNNSFGSSGAQVTSPTAGAVYLNTPVGSVGTVLNALAVQSNGNLLAAGANYANSVTPHILTMNIFNPSTLFGYQNAYTPVGAALNC